MSREPDPKIIIERKQVIGVVEPSPTGKVGMIEAAFAVCGKYFQENDDQPGFELQFTAYDRTFRAVLDPDPHYLENLGDRRANREED